MKTTITLLLLLVCTFLNAQSNENTLEVDIRGRECKGGMGICTMEITTEKSRSVAKFSLLKISETELQFTINAKELTIEEQKNIFGKEIREVSENDKLFFNQEYDFELNYDACKTLELNSKNPTIKNGIYPIKLVDNKAIITLKLLNKT